MRIYAKPQSMSYSRLWSAGLSAFIVACLLHSPASLAAEATEFDNKAAVILAYFSIGNDDNPNTSLRREQFAAQMEELAGADYKVKPLTDIIAAYKTGKTLPTRTVAITFDGADKSILEHALPLLEKYKFPFTVFVPTEKTYAGKPPYLSWSDLQTLKNTNLATFGLHPANYGRLAGQSEESVRREINNALSAMRKKLSVKPVLFSYPYGEYDAAYKKIVKDSGFEAALGQQSGVSYAGDDLYALPRFTQTERYGDLERFQMTVNALPFPVSETSPRNPQLNTLTPAIGFTVNDALSGQLADLSCFSSDEEKPVITKLNNRVEIRMEQALSENRLRINCTLPAQQDQGDAPRYRWLGMLFAVPDALLAPVATEAENSADYINAE